MGGQGLPSREPENLGAAGAVWPGTGQGRGWQTSVRGKLINTLGFAGHMISTATIELPFEQL